MTPTGSFAFFARTTQGLEDVTAGELRAMGGVDLSAIEHRLVSGRAGAGPGGLVTLRTADDVFVEVGAIEGLGRARSALALLGEKAAILDLEPARRVLRALRPLPVRPTCYVRASFVGKRNYTTAEIEEALAQPLLRRHRMARAPDDGEAALHLRLVLEGERARIGLRLAAAPLHERPWRRIHRPGSLKPAVAAALWRLAGLRPGEGALDPCCGSGTLLAEAAASGARAVGGDPDPEAVAACAANLRALGAGGGLARWDARRLPLREACIGAAASNLPWGRQVESRGPLPELHRGVVRELARVLAPGARAALLTASPELVSCDALREEGRREIGLFGQRPTVVVLAREARAA